MSVYGTNPPGNLTGWSTAGESGLRVVTSTEGFVLLAKDTAASTADLSAYLRTPDNATSNSITAVFSCLLGEATVGKEGPEVGICLHDESTGGYSTFGIRLNSDAFPIMTMRSNRASSSTAQTEKESEYFLNSSPVVWLRLAWEDTGTELNVRCFVSLDGVKWLEHDDARNADASGLVADVDKVGLYVENSSSMAAPFVTGQFFHFEETGSVA